MASTTLSIERRFESLVRAIESARRAHSALVVTGARTAPKWLTDTREGREVAFAGGDLESALDSIQTALRYHATPPPPVKTPKQFRSGEAVPRRKGVGRRRIGVPVK